MNSNSTKHTILFINRRMGFHRGGGEYVDLELARELEKRNHTVFFLIGADEKGNTPLPLTEHTTLTVRSPYLVNFWQKLPPPLAALFNWVDIMLFERAVKRKIPTLLKEFPIDTFQVLGLPNLAYWLQQSYPHFSTITRFPGPVGRFFYRKATQSLRYLFAPGDAYRQILKLNARTQHIPNGVDRQRFSTTRTTRSIRRDYNIPDTNMILLTVSRLVPLKNHRYALGAVARLKEHSTPFTYLIVGDGPLMSDLKEYVAELNLQKHVIFVGAVSKDETVRFYQSADIFILSSSYENFPNVIIEAFSCGVPAIATDVGGISLIVEDGKNGFLIPPNNETVFTERLSSLLNNPKQRQIFSEQARKKASTYSWTAAVDLYEMFFLKN